MRGVGATMVLVGVGWAASACGASVFACSSDAQCQAGAVAGQCQPSGYCSFPDESCPGGQRYGAAAPDDLANACVAADEATGTSTSPGISTTAPGGSGDEAPPDPDGTPEDATTGSTGEASTTAPIGEGTTTAPEPTTGMESEGMTTGAAATCEVAIVEPFDGPELPPPWSTFTQPGTVLGLDGGQLAISIGPNPTWTVAGAIMDVEGMAGGWARILVTEPDDSGLLIAGGLVVANEICHLQLFIDPNGLAATIWNNETMMTTSLGFVEDPGLPLWLQLRADEGGDWHFEHSPDAIAWDELAWGSYPECGDLLGGVITGVNVGGQLGRGVGTRYFDQFELCLP